MKYVQVSNGEIVASDEWLLELDDLIKTNVRVEVCLDLGEDGDRSVGTTTASRRTRLSDERER